MQTTVFKDISTWAFMLREGVRKGALSLFIPIVKDAFRPTIGEMVLQQKHWMNET